MDTYLTFAFKWALHLSILAVKLLTAVQSYLLRHLYDTPTSKSNALRLVSNDGQVKRLLRLYKWLKQPNLSLLWLYCNW